MPLKQLSLPTPFTTRLATDVIEETRLFGAVDLIPLGEIYFVALAGAALRSSPRQTRQSLTESFTLIISRAVRFVAGAQKATKVESKAATLLSLSVVNPLTSVRNRCGRSRLPRLDRHFQLFRKIRLQLAARNTRASPEPWRLSRIAANGSMFQWASHILMPRISFVDRSRKRFQASGSVSCYPARGVIHA